MPAPFLYRVWVVASAVLLPLFARRETRKLRRAGVPAARLGEKRGRASVPRPTADRLIWFHAASVGESLSVLTLITALGRALPSAHFVITSGTATSAALIAERLPDRTLHQFAPLDAPGPMRRFLAHWRPDAAVFVESELWPQMLRRTYDSGAKLALVNARLSEKSRAQWRKRPRFAAYVMDVFALILTQNASMKDHVQALGAPAARVKEGVNLKAMAAPLPVSDRVVGDARKALGTRALWVAASTHAGEEESVIAAHKQLLETAPELHLILVPRHPERGDAVAELLKAARLPFTRRSLGEAPGGAVYLADTLGELGTWYTLSDVVFLGGSLRPIGGHNPFEVAHAGAAVLSGGHVFNFAETFAEMERSGAARLVADADDLAAQAGLLLRDTQVRQKAQSAATTFIKAQTNRLDAIAAQLVRALELSK